MHLKPRATTYEIGGSSLHYSLSVSLETHCKTSFDRRKILFRLLYGVLSHTIENHLINGARCK